MLFIFLMSSNIGSNSWQHLGQCASSARTTRSDILGNLSRNAILPTQIRLYKKRVNTAPACAFIATSTVPVVQDGVDITSGRKDYAAAALATLS